MRVYTVKGEKEYPAHFRSAKRNILYFIYNNVFHNARRLLGGTNSNPPPISFQHVSLNKTFASTSDEKCAALLRISNVKKEKFGNFLSIKEYRRKIITHALCGWNAFLIGNKQKRKSTLLPQETLLAGENEVAV